MTRGLCGRGSGAKLWGCAVFEVHHVAGFANEVDNYFVFNHLVVLVVECVSE